ncbi:MAG: CDP-diacylglycerol--serine O-phosphatidyltransferase [Gammaproteobacteria bacterium]|nr:MAG: CDP-diacylglycerol--serine O-phosphatidyltransferase [Gammaproteobacteria bacterium]
MKKVTKAQGIYLLPNLLTTGNLFAGFYAITAAMTDRFEAAAIAIFAAMILDGLDGRVARMTHTQSAFGAEYDSLSDMVSFGVAPALIAYEWMLRDLGKLGWFAAFVYAAAAALRLARFNTQVGKSDKRYFQGLASPAAAALIAGLVWVGVDFDINADILRLSVFVITLLAGILMFSNVRYHSFKEFDLKGKVPFLTLVSVMLAFAVIRLQPPLVLFTLFLGYAISGPLLTLYALRIRRAERGKAGKLEPGASASNQQADNSPPHEDKDKDKPAS